MTIRAVIFDLGGVLVRTADFSPREALARQYGMTLDEIMGLVFAGDSGTRAQLGEVTYEQHWEYIRQKLGLSPDELQSFHKIFWSEDFVDLELVNALRRLHSTHRTALLSNALSDLRRMVTDIWKFSDAFDEIIISSEVSLMKPDPRIYQLTLERLAVQPEEAVFADDMLHNVEGARAVGMYSIQYKNTPQVLADLGTLLNGR